MDGGAGRESGGGAGSPAEYRGGGVGADGGCNGGFRRLILVGTVLDVVVVVVVVKTRWLWWG